jgi:hypothetical protein
MKTKFNLVQMQCTEREREEKQAQVRAISPTKELEIHGTLREANMTPY